MDDKLFKYICVPVDNSEHSDRAMELGVALARNYAANLAGSHVYAAKLHDVRFKQMEFTLPDEYKEETELEKQRRIHDALITRGLQLISDSYLLAMEELAVKNGVEFERRCLDGRNFELIVQDVEESQYDLVVMGALGHGAVKDSKTGSVCERVLRRSAVDTLVVRSVEESPLKGDEAILVAFDGSQWSWGAHRTANPLAAATGRPVDIALVCDAGSQEDELLQAHIGLARKIARNQGVTVRTSFLEGQAAPALLDHLERSNPWMATIGRYGIDATDTPEVGSTTMEIVRNAPCNVLISSRPWRPSVTAQASQSAAAQA